VPRARPYWLPRLSGGESIPYGVVYLRAENRVLRARLGPKRLRFASLRRCRATVAGREGKVARPKASGRDGVARYTRDILRWYREQVAAKYDGSRTRGAPGRPASRGDKVKQRSRWRARIRRGATRGFAVHSKNLGFDLRRSTLQRILTDHGLERAPLRGRTMPWKTFLKAHWGAVR
jgi:hypothetical protein